jgi:hypothetical protein
MRKFLLLIILAIFHLPGFGQTLETPVQFLAVEKATETGTVTLIFKPGSTLKIKTSDGAIKMARDYSLLDGALLINQEETIPLHQITSIKGRVYRNTERKVFGAVVAAGSVPLGFVTVFILAWSGWPILPTAIPFVGMMAGGISLMGARRFNALDTWTLIIVEQE